MVYKTHFNIVRHINRCKFNNNSGYIHRTENNIYEYVVLKSVTNIILNMNKLSLSLLLAGIGLIVALTAFAKDEKPTTVKKEVFPSKIETFVETNIPNGTIIRYKHEGDKMEVKCNDHTELCFNKDGECIKMENENGLNQHLIAHLPDVATAYLKNNYNNVAVSEIEMKSYGFKVELKTSPNDCDIWFNKDGSVKKECDY